MRREIWIKLSFGMLMLSSLFCAQNIQPTATPTLEIPPTATSVFLPLPPDSTPIELPGTSELQAIVQYANDLNPWLTQASQILEHDAEVLKEAENGNDAALCGGRLDEDNIAMKRVVDQFRVLSPPPDAVVIHNLFLESGQAWTDALDNVKEFCDTGNQLFKIPAILKYWEAAAKLQDAWNRFWALIIAKGLEDWVQR